MRRAPHRALLPLVLLAFALALVGCAGTGRSPIPRPVAQFAPPPAADGPIAAIEAGIRARHGADVSGFELLDRNEDGLAWRLALIDSARSSIDLQYYVWFGDAVGRLVLHRVLKAADRGVKVRILIDDLNSLLRDMSTVALRDEAF